MSETTEKKPVVPAMDAGYETSDTRGSRVILGFLIAVVVLGGIIVGLMYFYNSTRDELVYENVLSKPNPALIELHAREQKTLNSYAWVDSSQGIVQIPIDRAMTLMVNEAQQERMKHSK